MMNIILEDGFAIQKGTGIGQYTLNLAHFLRNHPEIHNVWLTEKPFLKMIPSRALRRVLYVTWLNSYLQLLLKRNKIDIVHFTNYLIPAVKFSNVKYVVTIHDLTAWKFPETLPSVYVTYIKWAISYAVRKADLICTVSNTVKKEIVELFGVDSEKIYTVYSGVSQQFLSSPRVSADKATAIKKKFGIEKNFLLFVGTLEERKNLLTLLKAFKIIEKQKDIQLVLIGRPGYGFSKIEKYLNQKSLKEKVILTGYITEAEKIALYDLAAAFIFPSLYEGFGIPLVEAMVRKVPIVASSIGTTKEVAAEAALYYGSDPYNYNALSKQILKVLENNALVQTMIKKGLERAKKFSWERVAQNHLQAYRKDLEH